MLSFTEQCMRGHIVYLEMMNAGKLDSKDTFRVIKATLNRGPVSCPACLRRRPPLKPAVKDFKI